MNRSLTAQLAPGGAPLVIHGSIDGYTVDCDGQIVAKAPTFLDACEALHRLRAIRAFAKEELFHTLAKKAARHG